MIKILCILLFLLPQISISQVSLNFGIGTMHSKTSHPIFKLSVQGEYHHFIFEAAEYPILSREVNPGNYLGPSVGYRIWKFIPTVGYLYNLRSSDLKGKQLNGWKWKAGLKFFQMINFNAGLYAETLYVDRNIGINAGVVYTF